MKLEDLKKHIIEGIGKEHIEGDYIIFDADADLEFQVLKNFNLLELLTKNKKVSYTKLNLNILLELQSLREKWGSPIGINSSYRSKDYNDKMEGAKASQHLISNALDTFPINGKIKEYQKFIKENKKTGGVGMYKTFVHIDCGSTRSWIG
ncbi:MAG TPA: D-Ala-D-Ala carboxypeptidase family metallohydrolase [Flavobacterium sp.]